MGDSNEELEPLFDYTRVQPADFVNLEEDSDSSPANSPKRRKCSKTGINKEEGNNDEKGKSIQVIDSEEEEDKENWLPPPPKNVGPPSTVQEDSTVKELRLKRQQLASVVQSTEHVLQAADETARRSFATSSYSVTEETTEEELKTAVDRTKIVISIQDKAGTKQYRIYADDKFEQLFRKYAEKANNDVHKLVFSFDGDKIDPATTPQTLGMEDDDLIEVHVKTS
ncbi:Small ubiquitin-related modifier 3 [Bienertia sinuspersici]